MKRILRSLPPAASAWPVLAMLLAAPGAHANLANALNPSLTWTTSPTLPWSEVYDVTYDEIAAAQSAFLQPGQQSWLRTTVTGPGRIEFWWKVSSDLDFGFLRFKLGTNYLDITGEVDWTFVSIPVPAGDTQLEWIYDKRAGASMVGDAGWLDEVAFVAGPTPPFVFKSPDSADLVAGFPLHLSAVVLGSEPLHYQWQKNGTNIPGATSLTYSVNPVGLEQAGDYRLVVTNLYGTATSAVATITVRLDPLGAALNPQLLWETTDFAPWVVQTNVTHDGVSAAQSGQIYENEYSAVSTRVTGPGEVSFWWKLSADDSDVLDFTINGQEQDFIYGLTEWEKRTFPVPPGEVVLEWAYLKDSLFTSNDDTAYLDEVTFTPATRLTAPALSNNTFTVKIATQAGRNYALEYRDSLGGTNWFALPTVPGDGAVKTLSDPAPSPQRRFYRVKQF